MVQHAPWIDCTFSLWHQELAALVTGRQTDAVLGSESTNLGGFRIIQTLSKFVQQLFELSFCSSEREKKKEEKKYGRDCSPVGQ
jgi:hypothetical protein